MKLITKCLFLGALLTLGCGAKDSQKTQEKIDRAGTARETAREDLTSLPNKEKSVFGNETDYTVIDTGYWVVPQGSDMHWLDNNTLLFRSSKDGKFVYRTNRNATLDTVPIYLSMEANELDVLSVRPETDSIIYRVDCFDGDAAIVRHLRERFTADILQENEKYILTNIEPIPDEKRWPLTAYDCSLVDNIPTKGGEERTRILAPINVVMRGDDFGGVVTLISNQRDVSSINVDFTSVIEISFVQFLGKMSFISMNQEKVNFKSTDIDVKKNILSKFIYLVNDDASVERISIPKAWNTKQANLNNVRWTVEGPVGASEDLRIDNRRLGERGLFLFDQNGDAPKLIIMGWVEDVKVSPDGCTAAINHVSDLKLSGNVKNNARTLKIVKFCQQRK